MKIFLSGVAVGALIIDLLVTVLPSHTWMYRDGFKAGQIAALTGHVEYKLITYPDSTRTWIEAQP